ncbi:MAG: hypothetical protein Fur0022_00640 [Anaerolineales bacterium]
MEAKKEHIAYVRAADSSIVSRLLRTYIQLSKQDDFEIRLNEVRRVLEAEIAALAAERATPEQRVELRQLCQEMRSQKKAGEKMAELDFRLHLALAKATQNELFSVLWKRSWNNMKPS